MECGHAAGLRLRYPQNPDYVHGSSERPVQEALAGRLCRGDVFYDIGANVGFFSLLAARLVGPGGYVCAFEPHPRNAATVAANAALNAMPHLRVFEVAVGAFARRDELLMTEWDGGATLSGLPLGPSAPVARAAVEVVPLDEFVPAHGLPLPTFVKIDVEGAEVEVIDGMVRTIEQSRPVLLYEVDDGDEGVFRRRWDELDRRVRGLGYDVTRLENAYPGLKWYVGHSIAMPDGCGAAQPISKVAPAPRVVGSPNERGGG